MKRFITIFISAVLISCAVSCEPSIQEKKKYPRVEGMEVFIDGVPVSQTYVMEKDVPSSIEVKIYPSDLEVKRIVCTSSDTTILKINADGTFTANGYGAATLTVVVHAYGYGSYAAKSAEIAVSVKTVELTGLSIGCKEQQIKEGRITAESDQELHLFPVLEPSNSAIKDIRWETSSNNISIDENGILTARRDGRYNVSLTVSTIGEDYSVKDTFKSEIEVQFGKMISFADPAMEKICVKYYDSNKDGYVSYQEAEAIRTWSETICQFNENIRSFNEFKYFKNIQIIAARAFWGCTSLEEINLPEGISEIYPLTFSECISLKKVTFSSDIKKFHYKVFGYCSSLTDIEIPESVEVLEDNVFYGANNLQIKHLYLPNLEKLGTNVFTSVPSIQKVTFGKNIKRIAEYAIYFCPNITEVTFHGEIPPECGKISFWSDKYVTVNVPKAYRDNYTKKYLYKDTMTTSNNLDLDRDIIRFENDEIEGNCIGDILTTPYGWKINLNQIIRTTIDGKYIPVILKDNISRSVGYDKEIDIVGY